MTYSEDAMPLEEITSIYIVERQELGPTFVPLQEVYSVEEGQVWIKEHGIKSSTYRIVCVKWETTK